ncbi:MAG: hypothetical protein KAW41_05635 [Candidatus Diapherotrites archaeon]|nr:hypothetical protein [Candidatus Diapherotrites archaeon]
MPKRGKKKRGSRFSVDKAVVHLESRIDSGEGWPLTQGRRRPDGLPASFLGKKFGVSTATVLRHFEGISAGHKKRLATTVKKNAAIQAAKRESGEVGKLFKRRGDAILHIEQLVQSGEGWPITDGVPSKYGIPIHGLARRFGVAPETVRAWFDTMSATHTKQIKAAVKKNERIQKKKRETEGQATAWTKKNLDAALNHLDGLVQSGEGWPLGKGRRRADGAPLTLLAAQLGYSHKGVTHWFDNITPRHAARLAKIVAKNNAVQEKKKAAGEPRLSAAGINCEAALSHLESLVKSGAGWSLHYVRRSDSVPTSIVANHLGVSYSTAMRLFEKLHPSHEKRVKKVVNANKRLQKKLEKLYGPLNPKTRAQLEKALGHLDSLVKSGEGWELAGGRPPKHGVPYGVLADKFNMTNAGVRVWFTNMGSVHAKRLKKIVAANDRIRKKKLGTEGVSRAEAVMRREAAIEHLEERVNSGEGWSIKGRRTADAIPFTLLGKKFNRRANIVAAWFKNMPAGHKKRVERVLRKNAKLWERTGESTLHKNRGQAISYLESRVESGEGWDTAYVKHALGVPLQLLVEHFKTSVTTPGKWFADVPAAHKKRIKKVVKENDALQYENVDTVGRWAQDRHEALSHLENRVKSGEGWPLRGRKWGKPPYTLLAEHFNVASPTVKRWFEKIGESHHARLNKVLTENTVLQKKKGEGVLSPQELRKLEKSLAFLEGRVGSGEGWSRRYGRRHPDRLPVMLLADGLNASKEKVKQWFSKATPGHVERLAKVVEANDELQDAKPPQKSSTSSVVVLKKINAAMGRLDELLEEGGWRPSWRADGVPVSVIAKEMKKSGPTVRYWLERMTEEQKARLTAQVKKNAGIQAARAEESKRQAEEIKKAKAAERGRQKQAERLAEREKKIDDSLDHLKTLLGGDGWSLKHGRNRVDRAPVRIMGKLHGVSRLTAASWMNNATEEQKQRLAVLVGENDAIQAAKQPPRQPRAPAKRRPPKKETLVPLPPEQRRPPRDDLERLLYHMADEEGNPTEPSYMELAMKARMKPFEALGVLTRERGDVGALVKKGRARGTYTFSRKGAEVWKKLLPPGEERIGAPAAKPAREEKVVEVEPEGGKKPPGPRVLGVKNYRDAYRVLQELVDSGEGWGHTANGKMPFMAVLARRTGQSLDKVRKWFSKMSLERESELAYLMKKNDAIQLEKYWGEDVPDRKKLSAEFTEVTGLGGALADRFVDYVLFGVAETARRELTGGKLKNVGEGTFSLGKRQIEGWIDKIMSQHSTLKKYKRKR